MNYNKFYGKYFWDHCSKEKLEKLISNHLGNPNEPERIKIRSLLQELNPVSVLDAACSIGTEFQGYQEAGLNFKYVGVDISKRMLSLAKEKYPNGTFLYGDVENLPFIKNSFDVVLLKHILEHLQGYKRAVLEAKRVARNNVLINLFKKFSDKGEDIYNKTKSGYWDNTYDRKKFENFLSNNFTDFQYFCVGRGDYNSKDEYDYDSIYLLEL